MRQRFGERLWDGIAGENVLVAAPDPVSVEQLRGGIGVRSQDGQMARLDEIVVAEPCVEFSRFALGFGHADRSNEHVTQALRFLRQGMRGFYATFAGEAVVLRRGDAVFALDFAVEVGENSPRRA
jgi:hypothetical protein